MQPRTRYSQETLGEWSDRMEREGPGRDEWDSLPTYEEPKLFGWRNEAGDTYNKNKGFRAIFIIVIFAGQFSTITWLS